MEAEAPHRHTPSRRLLYESGTSPTPGKSAKDQTRRRFSTRLVSDRPGLLGQKWKRDRRVTDEKLQAQELLSHCARRSTACTVQPLCILAIIPHAVRPCELPGAKRCIRANKTMLAAACCAAQCFVMRPLSDRFI